MGAIQRQRWPICTVISISRRVRYLVFNWRQLVENTTGRSPLTLNSSRTVENQPIVLFWLLTGVKFPVDWYIGFFILKKKNFQLIRGGPCYVMKLLQLFPRIKFKTPFKNFLLMTQRNRNGPWKNLNHFCRNDHFSCHNPPDYYLSALRQIWCDFKSS